MSVAPHNPPLASSEVDDVRAKGAILHAEDVGEPTTDYDEKSATGSGRNVRNVYNVSHELYVPYIRRG